MTERAVLVSNVKHIRHQIEALVTMGYETHLWGLRLFDPHLVVSLQKNILTQTLAGSLERRKGSWPESVNFRGLGPGTYTPIIQTKLRLGDARMIARSHLQLQKAMVRFYASTTDRIALVHAVEGLGNAATRRRRRSAMHLIVERRSLHPHTMAELVDPLAGYPLDRNIAGVARPLESEFEEADAVIVYSELAKQSFIENGFSKEKIWIVPIPFDSSDLMPPAEMMAPVKRFLFVGACQAYKGLDVAMAATAKFGGRAELRIAGYARPEVQEWMHAMKHATYLGICPRNVVEKEMRSATALVMPSKESLGLAILEGIRAGIPCLVSDQAGVASVLGKYAPECIVEGRDPGDWFARLDWIARLTGGERTDLIEKSQKTLQHYTFEESVSAQRNVYEALVS